MIVGLGVDIVNVPSFSDGLAQPASGFRAEVFSAQEREDAASGPGEEAQRLAVRWAAKEAALKALDTACAVAGAEVHDISPAHIEVVRDRRGRPSLHLHHAAADIAARAGVDRALLTLSHDGDNAVAVVVLESLLGDASAQ